MASCKTFHDDYMIKEFAVILWLLFVSLFVSVHSHGDDDGDNDDDDDDDANDDANDDSEILKDAEKFLKPDLGQELKSVKIEKDSRSLPFVGPWINYAFDPCEYEKAEGIRCSKYSPRKYWFYDKIKDSCELFIFRGCEGNANRYKYKSYCEMCLLCRQERRYQDCNKIL